MWPNARTWNPKITARNNIRLVIKAVDFCNRYVNKVKIMRSSRQVKIGGRKALLILEITKSNNQLKVFDYF